MKKLLLNAMVLVLALTMSSCENVEKKVMEGYKFNKERGVARIAKSVDFCDEITIDMFIKLHSYPTTWTSVISKFLSDSDNEFHLRIKNQDTAQWYYGAGDRAFVLLWNPSKLLPLNEWVRLTAIRDRKEAKLSIFINGKEAASKTFEQLPISTLNNADIVLMGTGRLTLDATIAELRIWKTVLDGADIEKTTTINEPEKHRQLVGYWRFDGVKKDRIPDISGNRRDIRISKVK